MRNSGLAAFPTTPVSRSTVPSRSAVLSLSGLCMKRRRTPGRLSGDARNERRAEIFDKAFTGAQGEGANQLREVRLLGRPQHRFCVLHQLADPLSQVPAPEASAPGRVRP